jgi:hypothetical protein
MRILGLLGAAAAMIFAIDFVRAHHDDGWRYVEVLPLLIAFSLLLLVGRPKRGR